MPDSPSTSPTITLIMRFWLEKASGQQRWRGHIEHVPSGISLAFAQLDDLISFLQRFGLDTHQQVPRIPRET